MTGEILQLNVSRGGIPKRAVSEVALTVEGLVGDGWAHPKIHGGPNQALLLIGDEVIEELSGMGYKLYRGALGENLTTRGLDYRQLAAGQRFRLGAFALIETTKLRAPCKTLDVYNEAGLTKIQTLLKERGRGGWYVRVIEGGPLFTGDTITLVDQVV